MKQREVDLAALLARVFTRGRAIFLVGLGGMINEVFIRSGSERPSILAALMGMIGLPAFVKLDAKKDEPGPKGKG